LPGKWREPAYRAADVILIPRPAPTAAGAGFGVGPKAVS